jgi:hypothetical protein
VGQTSRSARVLLDPLSAALDASGQELPRAAFEAIALDFEA